MPWILTQRYVRALLLENCAIGCMANRIMSLYSLEGLGTGRAGGQLKGPVASKTRPSRDTASAM